MTRQPTPDILDNVLGGATGAACANDSGTDGYRQRWRDADARRDGCGDDHGSIRRRWPMPARGRFRPSWFSPTARNIGWLIPCVNAAHRSGKFSQIPADVRSGTRQDAVLHAAGANASHGFRRTDGDKRAQWTCCCGTRSGRKWSTVTRSPADAPFTMRFGESAILVDSNGSGTHPKTGEVTSDERQHGEPARRPHQPGVTGRLAGGWAE